MLVRSVICSFSDFDYFVWKWHHIEYNIDGVGPGIICFLFGN